MGGATINTLDCKEFGEVTSVSYSNGLLATAHSIETVHLWRPKRLIAADGN
jgi:hypothetical protein